MRVFSYKSISATVNLILDSAPLLSYYNSTEKKIPANLQQAEIKRKNDEGKLWLLNRSLTV